MTARRLVVPLVALILALAGCGTTNKNKSRVRDERATALAIGAVLAADCGQPCRDVRAERVAPGIWQVSAVKNGKQRCALIWLDRFDRKAENDYVGAAPMRCRLNP